MKKVFDASMFLIAFLSISYACQQEESYEPLKGTVTFSFIPVTSNGQVVPTYLLISVDGGDGSVPQNIRLPISLVNQVFTSEKLTLPAGTYQLQQFTVIDSNDIVLYAAPKKGSDKAKYVANPLLIEFTVGQKTATNVTEEVLTVSPIDTPDQFGYTNFGIDGAGHRPNVLIRTNVKIEIGDVLYEDVDAQIRVSGYDSYSALQWTKDFTFIGPNDNILAIENGFHHYSIELLDKWGIHDVQSDISAQSIWEGRADGPLPITYVLAGTKDARKLSSYVTSFEVDMPDGSTVLRPETRVLYKYNATGQIENIRYELYNSSKSQFEESSIDIFTYTGTTVSHITTYLLGKLYADYDYQYGMENKITATLHYDDELVWTQTAAPNEVNDHITVNNTFSNGNSFKYEFDIVFKNNVRDKDIKGTQLCNKGNYQYDKYINPFRHLGYTDINFRNWSVNNKLLEDVHYLACGFPTLVPVYHEYLYNQDGYPTNEITTYKVGSFDGAAVPNTTRQSETVFYYQ